MRKAYLELHLAVLLFGFTAILGKLISLPAVSLVWWRVCITSLSMLFLVGIVRTLRELPLKRILQYLGVGCIVGLHWMTFFGSIKASNASVALVAIATTSFFTSLIEPLILRRRAVGVEMFLGILIIPAMILVVRGVDTSMHTGIWLGLASAVLAALFASLNKLLIGHAKPLQIAYFELTGVWIFVSVLVLLWHLVSPDVAEAAGVNMQLLLPEHRDWIYLLILALVCTTLAYVLAIQSLRHLSAFASTLVINLEPVYGIVLAWLILKENRELSGGFYAGVGIILLVVFSYPFLRRVRYKNVKP